VRLANVNESVFGLIFPDRTVPALLKNSNKIISRQHRRFGDSTPVACKRYLELKVKQAHFVNATSVRNAIERVRLRQASRVLQLTTQ
jgi:hypothetical protein